MKISILAAGLLVLVALVASAQPVNAVATSKAVCEEGGGTWIYGGEHGDSEHIGTCAYYPGHPQHTDGGCAANERREYDYLSATLSFDQGCVTFTTLAERGTYCGPIDLPRIIAPSAATEISFKGSAQTAGAALVVPGLDGSFPVSGLSYDWTTKTWTGTVNTLNIPADKYQNVKLALEGKSGGSVSCNVGPLTVSD